VSKLRSRGTWLLLIVLAAASGIYLFSHRNKPEVAAAPAPAITENAIACLGRIEPAGGLFQVAAPSSAGRPVVLSRLMVREGDRVRAGQAIATLDSKEAAESALRQSEAKLAVASLRLSQSKAGPKEGEVLSAKAELARLQAELEQARSESDRYVRLVKSGDLAGSEAESKKLRVSMLTSSIDAQRGRVQSLSEIRPADVDVAAAEVASAQADVARAKVAVEQAVVRSPIDGFVVRVVTKAGEDAGSQAIVSLAYGQKMYVLAEVYEGDLRHVKAGQRATVSSDALTKKLGGTVEKVGMEIGKTTVFPSSPAAVTDARVATVHILLDHPEEAMGLIGGQVTVAIAK
jgi:HlyD family secretion protein